jgi:DNA-binding response OmpR family regulator
MKKILIAEDDAFLANAYRVKLSKESYEVKIVGNGEEVIKTLPEFIPDLLLLDLLMPVRDGFSVLTEMKGNPAWNKIPVIVASNLSQPDDIVKATKLGADDYIIKTDLSLKEILAKIKKFLPE